MFLYVCKQTFHKYGYLHLKKHTVLEGKTFGRLFLYEEKDIVRFSYLHWCTFNFAFQFSFKTQGILSDCNWTQTHNHLVHKQTFNLASLVSLAVWPVGLNGWVFVYELCSCGFGFSCSHLKFRFRTCFEQGVPWHSGN